MTVRNISRIKTTFCFLFSLLYAYRLASIPSYVLSDRFNYALRYSMTEERLQALNSIFLFFAEPLYTLSNKALLFLNDSNLALQIFAFFICFNICFFSLHFVKHWYLSLLFLLLIFFERPTFLLHLNALRQGIGLSLLFLFFQIKRKVNYRSTIIFCCILGLFHLTFFLMAGLLFVDWRVVRKPRKSKNLKRLIVVATVSIFLSVFALGITNYLGAKQARDIANVDATVSGLGFLNVLLVFAYIWFTKPMHYENKKVNIIFSIHFTISIFYMGSYFILPTFARILSLGLPFSYFMLLYRARIMDIIVALLILCKAWYIFFLTDRIGIYVYVPLRAFFNHIFGLRLIK